MARFILLFLLIFLSAPSFSAAYIWRYTDLNGPDFGSATAACTYRVTGLDARNPEVKYTFTGISFVRESATTADYICGYQARNVKTGATGSAAQGIRRTGSQCENPKHTYNSQTGDCDPPKDECTDKAGQESPFSRSGSRNDGYISIVKNYVLPPDDGCLGGCQVTVRAECKFRLSTDFYSCRGVGYYTGAACVAAPATELDESPNTDPRDPVDTESKEPCVYVQDAEGRRHCVSKEVSEKEGQNCGTYNGVSTCFPRPATLDENKTETEIKETPKPDGGKEIVKTDVSTQTKCIGSKDNCATTTTTTTTTTRTDGSGQVTRTDTVCTGKACGSGTGGGGGGGGGGSGNGDGEGEDEGEGGELPGNDDVAGFGESLQSFNSRISGAPVLSAVSSISMPSGGSCNMPSASVPLLGTISFNQICERSDLLDPLYYLMLAVWALGAVRIFLEA